VQRLELENRMTANPILQTYRLRISRGPSPSVRPQAPFNRRLQRRVAVCGEGPINLLARKASVTGNFGTCLRIRGQLTYCAVARVSRRCRLRYRSRRSEEWGICFMSPYFRFSAGKVACSCADPARVVLSSRTAQNQGRALPSRL
jgi:hypothetical protein